MSNTYYVYILSNQNGVLYTGLTSDLERRIYEHRTGLISGFTRKYKAHRLIYFEEFDNIQEARASEKRIKGWKRKKKLELVRSKNPKFKDFLQETEEE